MTTIKTIGKSGQLSLGKEWAGRHVQLEELERGVWLLKVGRFIPDNERWLHQPEAARAVDEASEWAERHEPCESDLDVLATQIGS